MIKVCVVVYTSIFMYHNYDLKLATTFNTANFYTK